MTTHAKVCLSLLFLPGQVVWALDLKNGDPCNQVLFRTQPGFVPGTVVMSNDIKIGGLGNKPLTTRLIPSNSFFGSEGVEALKADIT